MKDLIESFEQIGIHGARACLQSGNVAFRCTKQQHAETARRVVNAVKTAHGFEPGALVIRIQELEHAIAANPYPEARKDPQSLYFWFLSAVPANPDLDALKRLQRPTERFSLHRNIFYLHAPDGIVESQLAEHAGECLGVEAMPRDWHAVTKAVELGWELA